MIKCWIYLKEKVKFFQNLRNNLFPDIKCYESYTGMNSDQNAQGTVEPVHLQSKLSSHAFMCIVILGLTWSGVIVQ